MTASVEREASGSGVGLPTNITQVGGATIPSGALPTYTAPLISEIDYVGGSNPIYVGLAQPGTATSAASWQIKKITYDGNNNPTSILYAVGSGSFNQIWDNRASLTYS